MEKYKIKRDGLPPIVFTGNEIGSGSNEIQENGNRANRWTVVRIYETKGGKFCVAVKHLTCWQGEKDNFFGASFATAAEVIEWLRADNGGEIGAVSQEAIEDAAACDDKFKAVWTEEVE